MSLHRLRRLTAVDPSALSRSFAAAKRTRRDMHCRRIVFGEFGDPAKVTSLVEDTIPDKLGDEQVTDTRLHVARNVESGFSGVRNMTPIPVTV